MSMPHEAQNTVIPLPFDELGAKGFESFVLAFLEEFPSWEKPVLSQQGSTVITHRIINAEPYAGASGLAQDGIDILATTDLGETWVFQCKHYSTKKFGKPAAAEAIEKATSGFPNADRYFLILSHEPTAPAIKEVLNHSDWEMWGGEKLSTRFLNKVPKDRHPDILRRIFGERARRIIDTLYPDFSDRLLQTPQEFFELWLRKDRTFHHRSQLVGRERDLETLHSFIRSPQKRICIFPAVGGRGKTRILKEIADSFPQQHPDKKLWFVNSSATPNAQPEQLRTVETGQSLLIQDDAHRTETLRPDLLSKLNAQEIRGKIILATRPQAISVLEEIAIKSGFDSSEIESLPALSKLKKSELRALARSLLHSDHQHLESYLADLAGDSPLIATVGAELINRGQIDLGHALTSKDLRREVFTRLEMDEFSRIGGNDTVLRDIISVIATLSPWDETEGLPALAALLGYTEEQVRDNLERLKAGSLIANSRSGLRVTPDLYSDFLVFRACYEKTGKLSSLARNLQKSYSSSAGTSILRNLSEAEWQAARANETAESLLEPFWKQILDTFQKASFWNRFQMLEEWASFSIYQPKRSLVLAELAINLNKAPKEPHLSTYDTHAKVLKAIASLLTSVAIYQDKFRFEALEILGKVALQFEENSALNALADIAAFKFRRPITAPTGLLEWLEDVLSQNQENGFLSKRSSALATVLTPIFSRTLDSSYSEGKTIHLSNPPINLDQTQPLRDHAIRIIRDIVIPHSEIATLGILSVIGKAIDIDRSYRGEGFTEELKQKWVIERLKAFSLMEAILRRYPTSRSEFRVRKLIKKYTQYAASKTISAKAKKILSQISDSHPLRWHTVVCSNAADEFYEFGHKSQNDYQERYDEAKEKWAALLDTTCNEFVKSFPNAKSLVDELDARIADHDSFGEKPNISPFLHRLIKLYPDLETDIIEEILNREVSSLDEYWTSLLGPSDFSNNQKLADWCKAIFLSKNLLRQNGLLNFLMNFNQEDLPNETTAQLKSWTISALGPTADIIIQNLRWTNNSNDSLWHTLLDELNLLELSEKQLETLIGELGWAIHYNDANLEEEFILKMFNRLENSDSLHDRDSEDYYQIISSKYPKSSYVFFKTRIEHLEKHPENKAYIPFPWDKVWTLNGLETDPEFDRIAEFLLSKVQEANNKTLNYWTTLFQWAVIQTSPLGLDLLSKKISQVEEEDHLLSLIDCIKYDGSMHIFNEPELVRALLKSAKKIAPSELNYFIHRLGVTAGPTIRGYTNGILDEKYQYFHDASKKAASRFADDRLLHQFYSALVEEERIYELRHKQWALESESEYM